MVPERHLASTTTKYDVRVRAEPNGEYFKGTWSPWSETGHFNTTLIKKDYGTAGENIILLITVAIMVFLLCLTGIIIIVYFWTSRIKPLVWPEIPSHKMTLEKLCKKPREDLHIRFSLNLLEDITVNKVDYIKAKEQKEDTSNTLFEEENSKTESDISGKENQIPVEESVPFLPLDSDEPTLLCSLPTIPVSDITHTSLSPISKAPCATDPSYGPFFVNSNPSNIISSLKFCTEIGCSNAGSNEEQSLMKALKQTCKEEAYISMSAFKTPTWRCNTPIGGVKSS
ncbi:hypothetical protein GDO86_002488 [Hymenochirus boettgeri]|uniref:Uncharacterized protein n=1 Tax=Hymenochirus boettgeri TaxID=247094 RepID=A0A8T2KJE8_9PIPI|nr:hypothetical protein GDO86_002488 [Hymenochirus boettgeri]